MNAISMPVAAQSGSLSERSMLVSLRISQWTGRRFDKKVTTEVNASHGAANDAGNFNKQLLPKEALSEISRIVGETRTGFLQRTLPWLDDGQRIMAASAYLQHCAWQRGQTVKFEAAVKQFLVDYPDYVNAARSRLGSMFKQDDYPLPSELEGKFGMHMAVMPVPQSEDFRANIADAQAMQIKADIERNVNDAIKTAMHDVWSRIGEMTERMAVKLNEFRPSRHGRPASGIFRDSLVENVKDMIAILPSLNIVGDPRLDEMVERLKTLTTFRPDTLRSSVIARTDTAAAAQAIADTIADYMA